MRWLLVGDSAQAYLGWEFFRSTPVLQWPLGANPRFGEGFSSTIVFADGIPLVAIILKPLTGWYDGVFQFHGWWLLTAFLLQAFFALKVLERLGVGRVARLLSLPLFLLQPAFLDRMQFEGYGHMALSAHWMILLGIWLYLRESTTHRQWAAVLVVAMGVTLYYFIILGIFYVAWISLRLWGSDNRRRAARQHSAGVAITALSSVGFAWIIGGFASTSLTDSGLGTYRATLVSLVDKATLDGTPWSQIALLPDITNLQGSQEGFAFLGFATFALLLIAIARLRAWTPTITRPSTLILVLTGAVFFVFALSPRIGLGAREVAFYEWPELIEGPLSVVRSSGRLMWIPMYLLTFFSVTIIAKWQHAPIRAPWLSASTVLLFLAFLFHIYDTNNSVSAVRTRFTETNPVFITDDPRWDAWASGKRHLVAIPPLSNDPRWIDLAVLAERTGLATNAAYVSRKNEAVFTELIASTQALLESRTFSKDTLYVITNYPPNPESPKLLAEVHASSLGRYEIHQAEELVIVVP